MPKKPKKSKDVIDLDNEIIIGLTPKVPEKQVKQPKNKTKKTKATPKQEHKVQKAPKKKKHSKSFKIFKWTSLTILIIAVIILFMLSPLFNVTEIIVEGTSKIAKEEIINLSQINLNDNTFKVKGVDVIERIKTNTYVDSVKLKRELPNGIKITIKERVPNYIIEIANGNAYIDLKGNILEVSTEKLQLPSLIGYDTSIEDIINYQNTKKLSENDCKKLERASQIYYAADNNAVLGYITSFDISNINNITLRLETENKTAYLGDGTEANIRILYLKKIIEKESGKEGEAFINGDLHTLKPKPYFRERV